MRLQEFHDYVFCPKVNMILDNGVFVGTQDYLFCFPSRTETHEYRKIITTDFSFGGKAMHEAIGEIIQLAQSRKELEEQLLSMLEEVPDATGYTLDELGSFRVEANFFGSGIHINHSERKVGFKPFIQSLGKDKKKQIKAFYAHHPKIK